MKYTRNHHASTDVSLFFFLLLLLLLLCCLRALDSTCLLNRICIYTGTRIRAFRNGTFDCIARDIYTHIHTLANIKHIHVHRPLSSISIRWAHTLYMHIHIFSISLSETNKYKRPRVRALNSSCVPVLARVRLFRVAWYVQIRLCSCASVFVCVRRATANNMLTRIHAMIAPACQPALACSHRTLHTLYTACIYTYIFVLHTECISLK